MTEQMADGLDLTPRDLSPVTKKNWLPTIVLVVVGAAIIAVLFLTLGSNSLFIHNVDDAVADRIELGEQRFRIQGTPLSNIAEDSWESNDGIEAATVFTIRFNGVPADVAQLGSPAELFQPGVPVVLDGSWQNGTVNVDGGASDGWVFVSDNMVVKHDNDYRLENQERIANAERGGLE